MREKSNAGSYPQLNYTHPTPYPSPFLRPQPRSEVIHIEEGSLVHSRSGRSQLSVTGSSRRPFRSSARSLGHQVFQKILNEPQGSVPQDDGVEGSQKDLYTHIHSYPYPTGYVSQTDHERAEQYKDPRVHSYALVPVTSPGGPQSASSSPH